MAAQEISKVGKRGTIVIPAGVRRRYGIEEGTYVTMEETEDGILIHGAMVLPIRTYTPQRKAEFLLSNAVDAEDYAAAAKEVREMGVNPDEIPHRKPPGA